MSKLKKRAIPTLIIAIFMISMLTVLPVNAATILIDVNFPKSEERFVVGDVIKVKGSGVTAGVPVKLYWDYVTTAGYMNETTGNPDGTYEVWMTVPESGLGAHYVWVKEMDTGTTASRRVAVDPEIELSSTSGLAGDPLTVEGHGYPGSTGIDIFFGTQPRVRLIEQYGTLGSTAGWDVDPGDATNDVVKLVGVDDGSEAAAGVYIPDGPTLNTISLADLGFSYYAVAGATAIPDLALRFEAPDCIDPDDETSLNRGHVDISFSPVPGSLAFELWSTPGTITVSDTVWVFGNKPETGEAFFITAVSWTDAITYLQSLEVPGILDWKLTRVSPQVGWTVIGTYYVDDVTIDGGATTYDLEQPIETSTSGSTGYFTATFPVPSDLGTDLQPVSAIGGNDNFAEAGFTIGACISLTPEEGPSGSIVAISGRGFPLAVNDVSIEVDSTPAVEVDPIATLADGTFEGEFIVPTLDVGAYTVTATADVGTAEASFDVTGTTGIELTPVSGEPSSDVTIEGVNFTAIADTEVTIDFGSVENYKTFYTNETGGFKETFIVPSLTQGLYTVTATDENGLTATDDFQIAITFASINPKEGPTGTQATILGLGFTGDTANVTLGAELIFEEIPVAELEAGKSFTMPTVPVDTYTITIEDSDGLTAITSFEVTKTTELILTPENAPVTYVVGIEANYFTVVEGTSIPDWYIYNATWSDTLTVKFVDPWAAVETNATGSFKGNFTVPSIALGDYFINATDANGLFANASFSVVEVYREIGTRLTEYDPGDTVSFSVKATFPFDLTIDIKDPTDYPFKRISVLLDEWVKVDDYYVVPYAKASFILPSDATPGAWNWTAYDVGVEPKEMVDTGLFTVTGVPPVPPELPAEVSGEETLDSTGAPKTSFALGETVLVSATVTNIGIESQPMLIVVQLMDPDLRALAPSYIIVTLDPGDSLTPSLGFIIPPTGYAIGEWTAKVMVLDTWPALGGVPIAEPVTVEFTVTS